MRTWLLVLLLLLPWPSNLQSGGLKTFTFSTYDRLGTVKSYIRKHEGLRLRRYSCPAGYPTIGYGHVSHTLLAIDSLKAEELLHNDLMKALSFVQDYPEPHRYAYAHFIYCLGIGNFKKGEKSFRKNPKAILKWCKYRKNGKLTFSPYLQSMRKWELNIINNQSFNIITHEVNLH